MPLVLASASVWQPPHVVANVVRCGREVGVPPPVLVPVWPVVVLRWTGCSWCVAVELDVAGVPWSQRVDHLLAVPIPTVNRVETVPAVVASKHPEASSATQGP